MDISVETRGVMNRILAQKPQNDSARGELAEARPSLVDQVYAALKRAIIESDFAPGMQLSGQELALRFGTSRTPIHEACLRLQEEGLVRILPKRGIVISALAPEDLREIFAVIVAIEGDAAALSAGLPFAERIALADALDRATDDMAAALTTRDFAARGLADAAFHAKLVEGCGNRRFVRIIQTVNDQSHRARVLTVRLRSNLEQSLPEHRAIAMAIRAGEPEAAFRAARAHRERASREMLPLIAQSGLRHF